MGFLVQIKATEEGEQPSLVTGSCDWERAEGQAVPSAARAHGRRKRRGVAGILTILAAASCVETVLVLDRQLLTKDDGTVCSQGALGSDRRME